MTDQNETNPEVLARVQPSVPRRWMAFGMLFGLGLLLVYMGFVTPPQSFALQIFLIVMGAGSIALAISLQKATQSEVVLTTEGLSDSAGLEIASMAEIARVERGVFAFKPSNGFMVHLNARKNRTWRPGLWWRFGRRIGIGGVTPGAQSKMMADILQAMIAERTPEA